ncbi:SDR family NAD(P)-dependent oxidoreductase [Humisphaera borealis]|uniref:SDR family NAD(P)-dependent oxidoreductase n=1 Tax=Humisphaera borealis TaxID=2807512 RepID=A0A7M2X2W1_9BACT|nr:SDR family NAD(P)-dependent oxidoreductase [Humisphaera borealis]QOV91959.1 SDR family NAD(P)-dependent oxidoreductase [Humisphaera borealis]
MPDQPTTSCNYLVVGATSGIARALVRQLADDSLRRGTACGFVLAGRDGDELERLAADLRTRAGAAVSAVATCKFDAGAIDTIPAFFAEAAVALPGGLQELVLCHGWLPDAEGSKRDPAVMRQLIDVNYTSAVIVLELAAAHFERQGTGAITGISSVAGDRGRQSNYPYGASKAALSAYLQGLRNRLYHRGIPVLTVKPGFTDTAMTWGRISSDSPLNASPQRVAGHIARAMRRRRNVIYTPWFWRVIMLVFTSLPESIFKRLKT